MVAKMLALLRMTEDAVDVMASRPRALSRWEACSNVLARRQREALNAERAVQLEPLRVKRGHHTKRGH